MSGQDRSGHNQQQGAFGRLVASTRGFLRAFFSSTDQAHRNKAVGLTECEVRELENMFVLLLMGSFTGLPAPPSFISAELLPLMEHELKVANRRAENADDALAEIAGCFDVT
ncbi:MAG: hypothetical protein EA404_03205 [Spirochaetaceae bacterium]|nr:MAG: hypothetical protein EA404_03205 [Spirochaetaceae bacterium]